MKISLMVILAVALMVCALGMAYVSGGGGMAVVLALAAVLAGVLSLRE